MRLSIGINTFLRLIDNMKSDGVIIISRHADQFIYVFEKILLDVNNGIDTKDDFIQLIELVHIVSRSKSTIK
jgi:hypothetical protein